VFVCLLMSVSECGNVAVCVMYLFCLKRMDVSLSLLSCVVSVSVNVCALCQLLHHLT
jgi:hypothetical protein